MNYRVTLWLLVVLLFLGAGVFYLEQTPTAPSPAASAVPASTLVWSIPASDVVELTVTSGGKTVKVVKDAGGLWSLAQPEAGPGDQSRIAALAGRFAVLSASRTIETPNDLAEFGLDKPSAEVNLGLAGGETKVLLIGDQTPDKSATYARVPESAAVLLLPGTIGSDAARFVSTPPKALSTPTVVAPPTSP